MEKKKRYRKPMLKRRLKEIREDHARQLESLQRIDLNKLSNVVFGTAWSEDRLQLLLDLALPELAYLGGQTAWGLQERDVQNRRAVFLGALTSPRSADLLIFVSKQLGEFLRSRGNLRFLDVIEKDQRFFETGRTITLGGHLRDRLLSDALDVEGRYDADAAVKVLLLCLSKSLHRLDFKIVTFCKGCKQPFEQKRKNQEYHSPKCKRDFNNASRDPQKKNTLEKQNRDRREALKEKKRLREQ